MSFFANLFATRGKSEPAAKPTTTPTTPKPETKERFFITGTKIALTLDKKIGEGGEGAVYAITNQPDYVAKIYSKANRTKTREEKIGALLAKKIPAQKAKELKLALPIAAIRNEKGAFCGYLMPKIDAIALKNAYFSRKRIETRFGDIDRRTLVKFCLHFIEQLQYLHARNILVGDINPLNILVDPKEPAKGWLIDTDSFQVDNLPCPVGTDLFTPARLQGKNFKTLLRSEKDELFSAAIMIFMILMLGKHPYARIGGENPADNIKAKAFPYRSMGKLDEVPAGIWGYIWSHFTRKIKTAFESVFREGKTVTLKEWKRLLEGYLWAIEQNYVSRDIVPLSFKSHNSTEVRCCDCARWFQIDENFLKTLKSQGKEPVCALCRQKFQATQLLKKRRDHTTDRIKHALFNARHTAYKL